MKRRYVHIADAWCDGSDNDRLILELHSKLSEEQKKKFGERMKEENSEEVLSVCWRENRVVRVTLRKKNCMHARMDLPRIADTLIASL